jgi:hypothetical protein
MDVEVQGEDRFLALFEELEDIERRRTGSGNLDSGLAVRRAHVERVVIERLLAPPPPDAVRAAERVRCDLMVRVGVSGDKAPGAVKDVCPGGIFVETAIGARVESMVELEVASSRGALEHVLRIRARVLGTHASKPGRAAGLTVAFAVTDEGGERRVRRFVDAVVRSRIGAW